MPSGNDDATRYLCAASYLDPAYNTRVIKEFLVEPTRPIPPSPGVDASRVLTEAVRARARRKNYDGMLVLITLLILGIAWDQPVLYAWILLSAVLSLPGWLKAAAQQAESNTQPSATKIIVGILVAIGGLFILAKLFDYFSGSSSSSSYSYSDSSSYDYSSGSDGSTARLVVAVILAFIALIITMGERWTLWQLLTTRFKRGAGQASDGGGSLTGFLTEDFHGQLVRHQEPDQSVAEGAPLIVYRGYNPFVGSGFRRDGWSMAIPLERAPDGEDEDDDRPQLTTETLYAHVRGVLERLQSSGSLSPDHRLRDLTVTEAVFTPAAELVDHLASPEAVKYLPNLFAPPSTRLPQDDVDQLRLAPREWARYYLCIRVETWDRDLVLSTFLHLAVDETTLYVEWTPFVLPPVKAEYRTVDKMRPDSYKPFGQGLLQWLRLPAGVVGGLFNLASWIRTPKRQSGVIDPDRYGAKESLRELASVNLFTDYFQLVDIERYEKIIGSRLLPAIGGMLGEAGFSTAKFDEQASVVINNEISIAGDNSGDISQTGRQDGRRRRRPGQNGSGRKEQR